MMNDQNTKLLINEKIASYRILDVLGEGASSTVYLAVHDGFGIKVALKVLKETRFEGEDALKKNLKQAVTEMESINKLSHPNIVKNLDVGLSNEGQVFSALELVNGSTLREYLQSGKELPIADIFGIMSQVLDALKALHQVGIIHCDLKPENIMLEETAEGKKVRILDFGMSSILQHFQIERTSLLLGEVFSGTPAYAAPEQLRGEIVSEKADIYSWGLIFLEMLMGKLPFKTDEVGMIVQEQLSDKPVYMPYELENSKLGALLKWVINKDKDLRAGSAILVMNRFKNIEPVPLKLSRPALEQKVVLDTSTQETLHQKDVSVQRFFVSIVSLKFKISSRENQKQFYESLLNLCSLKVRQFGGYLASVVGQNVVVFFGYPSIEETDAKQAASFLLSLKEELNNEFQEGDVPQIFASIHSGFHTINSKELERGFLPGTALMDADTLRESAEAGQIIVSEETQKLLRNSMSFIPKPLENYEKSFELVGETESIQTQGHEKTLFQGRAKEIHHVDELLSQSASGGPLILINGEAGIGKSRFLRQYKKKWSEQDSENIWWEVRCTREEMHTPLKPILSWVAQYIGISASTEEDKTKSHQLLNFIEQMGGDVETVFPIFCHWLGITQSEFPPPSISPQLQKMMLFQNIQQWMNKAVEQNKTVLAVEDYHWADSSTIEFIESFALAGIDKNLGILLTSRNEKAEENKPYQSVHLKPLNELDVQAMLWGLFAGSNIHSDVIHKLMELSNGLPLYTEELAGLVLDRMQEKHTQEELFDLKSFEELEIPYTLTSLIESRLSHVQQTMETINIASVLGPEFDYELLRSVSKVGEEELKSNLDQLISNGILSKFWQVDNPQYRFNHALMRESIYKLLENVKRKELHSKVAEELETTYSSRVESQPDMLAHHFEQAENFHKAIEYGLKASSLSLSKSLYENTIYYGEKALEWCKKLPDDKERAVFELNISQVMISALISTYGYAHEKLREFAYKVEAISKKLDDNLEYKFQALWGLLVFYKTNAEYDVALDLFEKTTAIASELEDKGKQCAIGTLEGNACYFRGEFEKAQKTSDMCLEYYDHELYKDHNRIYGHDSKIGTLATLVALNTSLGKIDKALETFESGIEWADELNDPMSHAMMMCYEQVLWFMLGDKEKSDEITMKAINYQTQTGLYMWNIFTNCFRGWAIDDDKLLRENLFMLNSVYGTALSFWNIMLAQLLYDRSEYQEAYEIVDKYIAQGLECGELHYLPELYRIKALCCKHMDRDGVEENFKSSIELANKIGSVLFELRSLIQFYEIVTDENDKSELKERIQSVMGQIDTETTVIWGDKVAAMNIINN